MLKITTPLILASASPRRQELMRAAGIPFEILLREVSENYPEDIKGPAVAEFLAQKKGTAYENEIAAGRTVITADTIVHLDGLILGKPENAEKAIEMLHLLSGKRHEVITAVCIQNQQRQHVFHRTTSVIFRKLTTEEIAFYVAQYKPFDKAGAYGIQEWIGHIGITSIEGSYDNVVGMPVAALYERLLEFHSAGIL